MTTVTVSSEYPVPQEHLWKQLVQSSTLVYITFDMQKFSQADSFPEYWQAGTEVVTDVEIFGIVTVKDYQIKFTKVDEQAGEIHTEESGGSVKKWNHIMRAEHLTSKSCRYTDIVEIDGGWATPLVCAYARYMYRRRQRYLEELLLI
jgi:hypothetical protein